MKTTADRQHYLYILYDPTYVSRTYYVGITYNPQKRMESHLDLTLRASKYKKAWIRKMLRKNVKPRMHLVYLYPNEDEAGEAEKALIKVFRQLKIKLCNIADGGKAPPHKFGDDHHSSKLTKADVDQIRDKFLNGSVMRSDLAKQYNVSLTQICRIVSYKTWNIGVEITEELMIKILQRIEEEKWKKFELLPEPWNKGKKMTEEYCLKISAGLTGLVPSEKTRAKRSKAMKGRMPKNYSMLHSKESNEKRTLAIRGENSGTAKLTEAKVIDLRQKHALKQYAIKELAEMFKIKECTVYDIVNRRSWKHI